jgi:hypothetical protein
MRVFPCLLFAGLPLLSGAQEAAAPGAAPEAPLDEIVVSGQYPGPGLWKVTRADDPAGHVLWIVGDPGALPEGMRWKSTEIESVVLNSQEILYDAGFNLASDEKVGFWRGLTLVPTALTLRRNPDDATLEDVLPPGLYARWLTQKKLYLGRDGGVENWRPLFAANKLEEGAMKKLGLSSRNPVMSKVGALAGQRQITQTHPQLKYTFKRSEIRSRMKEFSKESLADVECFAVTLDLVEALGRRDVENARHKAWARGDLPALKELPEIPNPDPPCAMAIMSSEAARDLVPDDLKQLLSAKWLEAAEASLAANQSTFAVLKYNKLTGRDGYLDMLRAKGYLVEDPS